MADKIHKHILATVKPVVTRQTDGGRMWGDEDDPRPDDFGQMLVNASALIEGGSRVYTVVAAKLAELVALLTPAFDRDPVFPGSAHVSAHRPGEGRGSGLGGGGASWIPARSTGRSGRSEGCPESPPWSYLST